ncbi:MAG: VIT domain-containing protein [Planctomycetota bacterium]
MRLLFCLFSILYFFPPIWAQTTSYPMASHIIVPQSRVISARPHQTIQITEINIGVNILQQVATTTMEIRLKNPTNQSLEAQMAIPIPVGAVIRGFTFQGLASEPTAQLLLHEEARRIYQEIVSKLRDPALLEFIGCNLVQSSVFPVEAQGTQAIRLTYEHLLLADGNRIDYVLPRTESVEYNIPWKITLRLQDSKPIATVYSPSHKIETQRLGESLFGVRLAEDSRLEPGAFLFSYLISQEGVSASLMAYPDPSKNGGYFLLLAGLPSNSNLSENKVRREVTLVLDRSGSMTGEKIEQVRSSVLKVIESLAVNEAFNIIIYNEYVDAFAPHPVLKTAETLHLAKEFLKGVGPRGGTNIHDALLESLRQKPMEGFLPIVLFLTDGLPTIGKTAETDISKMVSQANRYQRRVFTFGVGVDVNTPLLEQVATETRATATYVFPKENVDLKVTQLFKRLTGPILTDPRIEFVTSQGTPALGRVLDILPNQLPDLFEGDQLILLGQYIGEEPLTFRLHGNYLGKPKTFQFSFQLDKATTRNAFVPRLWASRKIAILIEEIRRQGAITGGVPGTPQTHPKLKELIDEIVRLSTEFGILTEYTAFLAREGTDLSKKADLLKEAGDNFISRAYQCRSGWSSVNQEINNQFGKNQVFMNPSNGYFDQTMKRVSITNVQQVNDCTFYQKDGCWVDSRVVEKEQIKATRTIILGSPEFYELVQKLVQQGRQGCIALRGNILLSVDGELILIEAK